MKGLLLNTLLGLGLGRFGSVWSLLVFVPVVAAEVAFGIYVYDLNTQACVRRGAALLVCGQIAFLLGALMRPMRGET
jgi:ABC-type spermidine/putrescine transport system permease subunit II